METKRKDFPGVKKSFTHCLVHVHFSELLRMVMTLRKGGPLLMNAQESWLSLLMNCLQFNSADGSLRFLVLFCVRLIGSTSIQHWSVQTSPLTVCLWCAWHDIVGKEVDVACPPGGHSLVEFAISFTDQTTAHEINKRQNKYKLLNQTLQMSQGFRYRRTSGLPERENQGSLRVWSGAQVGATGLGWGGIWDLTQLVGEGEKWLSELEGHSCLLGLLTGELECVSVSSLNLETLYLWEG